MIPDHPQRDYRSQRVLIMGLGSFGGGVGAVQFLARRGASITITDSRTQHQLDESLSELRDIPDLQLKLGGHDPADFQTSDLIVVNPAIRRDNQYLELARQSGVPLTSEMNLFWQWNLAPVVAITGSNGKSTTTALTHAMLSQTKRCCWLGGNIGISLLPRVDEIHEHHIVVLELSSFQLTDLNRLQSSPSVSVITNFAPNHLDWHTSLDEYRWAKQTMLRWQKPTDTAILNADDADVRTWSTSATTLKFGMTDQGELGAFESGDLARIRLPKQDLLIPIKEWLPLPGRHNVANALAATCAAMPLGADEDAVRRGLQGYQALPHRLQWIADVDGRSFYNDSLATTPESAIVALQAFDAPIVLLAGGYDKHVDLSEMAAAIASRVKAVALMGQTANLLRGLIRSHSQSKCVTSPELGSFRDAWQWALDQSETGDVILLSPGCASYDWFRNFADRGRQFIDFVQALQPSDH